MADEENTVTRTVENVDRMFSQIEVNGEVHNSENYTQPVNTVTEPVINTNNQNTPQIEVDTTPVTRTIENVDRMFSQIEINGETHNSENYTAPSTRQMSPAPTQEEQGEDVYAVELNEVLHNFVDRAVNESLSEEVTVRQLADNTLQLAINSINDKIPSTASASNKLVATDTITAVQASISDIEALIPAQATSANKLADKDFVNSSIASNTANFLGTYTSLADIEAIQNPTNNDYAFLQTTDSAGNTVFDRYKYNASQDEWLFEYELNNSSFTAEQWATINSGLTSTSITDAINALDVAQVGGNNKYIKSIKQVDGKIVAEEEAFVVALLNIAHPVGSLYWTSSSEDPAITFGGGTWKRIKDVFVWAKGDSDTVDATGGAKTVTLTTQQIPSHNHTFTPSGTVASHTHSVGAHAHGLNSHTHTLSHTHTINNGNTSSSGTITTVGFRGVAVTSGGSSATNTGSESSHTHDMQHYHSRGTMEIEGKITNSGGTFGVCGFEASSGAFSGAFSGATFSGKSRTGEGGGSSAKVVNFKASNNWAGLTSNSLTSTATAKNSTGAGSSHSHTMAHTHSVTASGYLYGKTDGASTTTTSQATGNTANSSAFDSGSTQPTFTGSAGSTGNAGDGQAHDNMPPYVVKYCWERTA